MQETENQSFGDPGLTGLSLIMELCGSLFAGYMLTVTLVPVFASMSGGRFVGGWVIFVIGALSVLRSTMHARAGRELIYGGGSLDAVKQYAGISLIHTVVVLGLADKHLHTSDTWALALPLLAWPLFLFIYLPKRVEQSTDPFAAPEDFGFGAASLLMLVFGVINVLAVGCAFLVMLNAGIAFENMYTMMIGGLLATFVIRSGMHTYAGWVGLHATSLDSWLPKVHRYTRFGIGSSIVAGIVLLLSILNNTSNIGGVGFLAIASMMGILAWMLYVWPAAIRRLVAEREFSMEIDSGSAQWKPASDGGLCTLGWLLLALGIYSLSNAALGLIFEIKSNLLFDDDTVNSLIQGENVHWITCTIAALQVWAGWECLQQSARYRLAGNFFGLGGGVLTLFYLWPAIENLSTVFSVAGLGLNFSLMFIFAQVAIPLVIPAITLYLVNRSMVPPAIARVRKPDWV